MKTFHITCAVALLLGLNQMASAHTAELVQYECPIGGEKFERVMQMSGTSFGQMTNLMPYGPIESPWPLAQCPGNKFIIFKNSKEFTPEEIKKYTEIVNSDAYKNIPEDAPSYYYLAKLYELAGDQKNSVIAYVYLQASWQNAGEALSEEIKRNVISYYEKSFDELKDNEGELIAAKMMIGEINRQLGNFDIAEKHFQQLKQDPLFTKQENIMKIIDFELKLIKDKSNKVEALPE